MYDDFIAYVLNRHREQFPFKVGRKNKNRERYYWLSGILHDAAEQMEKTQIPAESNPPGSDGAEYPGEKPKTT